MTSVLPYTFQSNTGSQFPKSGLTYYLPPPTENPFEVTGHVNRNGDAMQDLQEADGVYLTAGGDGMYRSYAEIAGTLDFFPAWLLNNSNKNYYSGISDDRAACLNAVVDFMQYVVQGGLGTLTMTTAPGSTFSSYTARALINEDYKVSYITGAIRAQIQCTFMIPSGLWTTNTGVLIPVH